MALLVGRASLRSMDPLSTDCHQAVPLLTVFKESLIRPFTVNQSPPGFIVFKEGLLWGQASSISALTLSLTDLYTETKELCKEYVNT